ncbi:MAG: galactokinase, partial [Saprospiraceae bacterium]|nr:galactokinase [Saprospiraceae bacterium]
MEDQGNDIRQIFLKEFETDCAFVSKAPGRINLIGEHTDYNMGLVMPAAIDKSVNIAFSPSDDLNCHFLASDLGESFIANLDKIQKSERSWVNYLLGILIAFKKRKDTKHGFYCVINSNIPIGAGMSSSAALECAFINGLNHMYEADFDRWERIEIIQESAHHFLGVKSGILDQFASLFGRKDSAVILDCGTHNYEYVQVPLQNHSFILVDTKVKHTHLTSAYNDRVEECNSALNKIQLEYVHIQSLSDSELKVDMIGDLSLSDTEFRRTKFIIGENQRVISFKKALESGNIDKLGTLLYDSHDGLR